MNRISEKNRKYYEKVWGSHKIIDCKIWSTWSLIKKLNPKNALEIGCGNKPRIGIKDNWFLDINNKVVSKLKKLGGNAEVFDLTKMLPFKNNEFDLVCAFEVLEHLEDDEKILREIARITSKKGAIIISLPLNMKYLTIYDMKVGHIRRYEPEELERLFSRTGVILEKYCPINIMWPSKWQAPIISWAVDNFPIFITSIQNWLDLLPTSPLRKELLLRNWDKDAAYNLTHETTALFLLRKKS